MCARLEKLVIILCLDLKQLLSQYYIFYVRFQSRFKNIALS